MENKTKILIIENQFTQFNEIIKLLDGEGYHTFPDENSYKEFIDWIKIYLNPRYTLDRRNKYLDKILKKEIEYNPDIFIIDHILVGTHNADNGIDLAIKFRERGINQPFIFFSRTEMNNIDVCEKLPKVLPEKTWIYKGYSGADILEQKFFISEVIPKIESLLKKSILNQTIGILNEKKPQSITSTTSTTQRDIANITLKIIELFKAEEIKPSDELLSKLSEERLDSAYLELLKSLLIEQ